METTNMFDICKLDVISNCTSVSFVLIVNRYDFIFELIEHSSVNCRQRKHIDHTYRLIIDLVDSD